MSNIVFCNFPLDIGGERIKEVKREQPELVDAIEEYSIKLQQQQDIETFSRFDNVIATEDGYYAAFYASDVREDDEKPIQVVDDKKFAAWFRDKLGTPKAAKVDILNIIRNLSESRELEWRTKDDQSFFGCVEFFATYKDLSIQIRRGYPVTLDDKYWMTICESDLHDRMMRGDIPPPREFIVIEPMRGVDKIVEMVVKSKFRDLKPTTDFGALSSIADKLER